MENMQPDGTLELRKPLATFAQAMEQQLRANDTKGGWENCGDWWLTSQCEQKMDQIAQILLGMQEITTKHQSASARWLVPGLSAEEDAECKKRLNDFVRQHEMMMFELTRLCADASNYLMMIADNFGAELPAGEVL